MAARELEAGHQARAEARRPFDLTRGPLLRAVLFRLGEREHVLALTLHHIVFDGWSQTVLIRDLLSLYQGLAVPALPVQYADFALWQRAWLGGEARELQLAYWRQRLRGAPPLLDLAADRPRPAVLCDRGATLPWLVPDATARGLRVLARREGASLFMVLLAAFKALLTRSTGVFDLTVGSPSAGRTHREVEELIGFFVNPVALRTDLSGDPDFRALVGRVRETTLSAYTHQDLPFELVVEALVARRSLSHTPLFQVVLAFQNARRATLGLPEELELTPVPVATGTAKYDLTLMLEEGGAGISGISGIGGIGGIGGIAGTLEYRTALFDETTVRRLLSHFEVLAAGAAAEPERRLSNLPLLTAPERGQLLVEWNDSRCAYPREAGIHERFAFQAGRVPDAVALVFGARAVPRFT